MDYEDDDEDEDDNDDEMMRMMMRMRMPRCPGAHSPASTARSRTLQLLGARSAQSSARLQPLPPQLSQISCFYYLSFGLSERNHTSLQKCPLVKEGILRNAQTSEV